MATASIKKPLVGVAVATALLLLIPAVAMRFTAEVTWGPGDFAAAAALLFAAGTAAVIAARIGHRVHRRAMLALIATALLLVWAELAVGLFH